MTIRLLPQNLINQIAAGEVVERPASALKELIENAIDAGSTKIDIVMENGGKTYFSVKDNGKGMTSAELELAVERHATSKLPNEDLFNINFLGFRGEALPSIASVSKLKITSRTSDSHEAWQISVNGGHKEPIKPTAFSQGTLVEVKDLFYATPARLKFLKAPQTELAYAKDIINHLSMAYPHISFSLSDGKRLVLNYPKTDDLGTRVAGVIGKDFDKNTIEVSQEHNGIIIHGFIGLPTYLRSTSTEQHLFINGRYIKDKILMGAIRGAYQGLLGHGHEGYPVLALFITIPNADVDVNVHPAKTEVRFKDSATVKGVLVHTIRQALSQHSNQASTTIAQIALQKSVPSFIPMRQHDTTPSYVSSRPTQTLMAMETYSVKTVPSAYTNTPETENESVVNLQSPNGTVSDNLPPLGLAKAQIHDTYILSQTDEGLIIVDQHAAHERLMYEKIMATIGEKPKTQILLIPEILDLKQDEVSLLLEYKETLANMGLILDAFGLDSVAVREIPAIMTKTNLKDLIQDLSDTLKEFGDTVVLKDKIKDICARIACHSSIRAGRRLTIDEMNALLRQMENCGTSGQCIHGRPTYITLKYNDIEKLFGRK